MCVSVYVSGLFAGHVHVHVNMSVSHYVTSFSPPLLCSDPLSQLPTVNGGGDPSDVSRRMRAVYGYNPATDSPNENKEEELCMNEGDIITVFGQPDEDGYYQVI